MPARFNAIAPQQNLRVREGLKEVHDSVTDMPAYDASLWTLVTGTPADRGNGTDLTIKHLGGKRGPRTFKQWPIEPQIPQCRLLAEDDPLCLLIGLLDTPCPRTSTSDWWAHQDSNLEPKDYESSALTIEL
jgi:hypothetical protein